MRGALLPAALLLLALALGCCAAPPAPAQAAEAPPTQRPSGERASRAARGALGCIAAAAGAVLCVAPLQPVRSALPPACRPPNLAGFSRSNHQLGRGEGRAPAVWLDGVHCGAVHLRVRMERRHVRRLRCQPRHQAVSAGVAWVALMQLRLDAVEGAAAWPAGTW